MAPRTRPPTGKPSWPLILVEGPEKAGKSYMAAEFTASPRIGQAYWIDLGEGAADEYAAIPGADYLVIDHDGTWIDILAQVTEVRTLAEEAQQRGEPPVVLVIDSMTAEWDLLKEWTSGRARESRSGKARLAEDPNAEIDVPINLWNDANARHRRLMTLLMTFKGVVVVTARGKEVAELDDNGRPARGNRKVYKVEGHKMLGYDVSAWVRLSHDHPPTVVGVRSVHSGLRPGVDEPVPEPKLSLDWLVFDLLKCAPGKTHARAITQIRAADRTAETIAADALKPTADADQLRELHHEAAALGVIDDVVSDGMGNEGKLRDLIAALGRALTAKQPATEAQHRHMHALWREAGYADDRDGRIRFTAEIVGRHLESSTELTGLEADRVIVRVKAFIDQEQGAPA